MNPDSDIKVAVVTPDGLMRVYDHQGKYDPVRKYLYSKQFSNYGAAVLAADELEKNERIARETRRK